MGGGGAMFACSPDQGMQACELGGPEAPGPDN